jgi:hypothetical protein
MKPSTIIVSEDTMAMRHKTQTREKEKVLSSRRKATQEMERIDDDE